MEKASNEILLEQTHQLAQQFMQKAEQMKTEQAKLEVGRDYVWFMCVWSMHVLYRFICRENVYSWM